jgi:hypothetical protein
MEYCEGIPISQVVNAHEWARSRLPSEVSPVVLSDSGAAGERWPLLAFVRTTVHGRCNPPFMGDVNYRSRAM